MNALITDFSGGEPGPDDRLEVCWPDGGNWRTQIQRSLVIGETLWTVSFAQLQANNLDDLATTGVVAF